ncbi:MAG: hypothetical protein ACLRPW_02900 [Intestinibacter sp.]
MQKESPDVIVAVVHPDNNSIKNQVVLSQKTVMSVDGIDNVEINEK